MNATPEITAEIMVTIMNNVNTPQRLRKRMSLLSIRYIVDRISQKKPWTRSSTPDAVLSALRASKYSCRPDEGRDFSGGLQHPQDRCGAAKEVEPAVVGGDLLIGSGAGTEEVA